MRLYFKMTKFKNIYRIESTRLQCWDYSSSAFYFVTICTKEMKTYLGKVIDNKVFLNSFGKIVKEEWQNTSLRRSNVKLDEFIIMPNHLHGIIIIDDELEDERTNTNKFHKGTLGVIVGQFKGAATKRIKNKYETNFAWQERFYEHIIRNENSLRKIREYIRLNPMKWSMDDYYIK